MLHLDTPMILSTQLRFRPYLMSTGIRPSRLRPRRSLPVGHPLDKRVAFAQWVGFSRMMLLRARRQAQGFKVGTRPTGYEHCRLAAPPFSNLRFEICRDASFAVREVE